MPDLGGVPEERHKFMPFLWNSAFSSHFLQISRSYGAIVRVFKQLLSFQIKDKKNKN